MGQASDKVSRSRCDQNLVCPTGEFDVPHSGFGLGLERTVAWVCGLKHVRETSPFPRMLTRLRP